MKLSDTIRKMKLIVGLGNPGTEFVNTRHNVGYLFVDKFSKKKLSTFVTKKTHVFMNDSGSAVKKFISENSSFSIPNLYIVHDDLDIPLGKYKIQFGVSPKDHNGLESVDNYLGTRDYWHVRIGVDNRDPKNRIPGEKYVLENFTDEERKIIDNVIDEICKKLATS